MIRSNDFDAVIGLVQAMATFDPISAQHLTATAELAERLASAMELEPAVVEKARIGALLHDVGQFGMDRDVLNYPGMLADAEWDVVTQHPILGERLLLRIPSIAHIAPIVRAHHERIDGTGYPDALLGDAIPIEARIVAVADAFHTMSMPQRYRQDFAPDRAIEELIGNSGSQFDRDVVDVFATMIGYRHRHLGRA